MKTQCDDPNFKEMFKHEITHFSQMKKGIKLMYTKYILEWIIGFAHIYLRDGVIDFVMANKYVSFEKEANSLMYEGFTEDEAQMYSKHCE